MTMRCVTMDGNIGNIKLDIYTFFDNEIKDKRVKDSF